MDYIKDVLGFKPNTQSRPVQPPTQAKPSQSQPAVPVEALGSGLARGAASALTNRQRQIDEASGYADGGVIRGKGTGTSDDIKKQVPAGTYIMPTDSTQSIGAGNLDAMGRQPKGFVPVNVSNGEYQLPPEQVHAIGVQTLDSLKNNTHTPVQKKSQGFKPENFFADGGDVDDPLKPKQFSPNTPNPVIQGAAPPPAGSVRGGLDPFAKTGAEQLAQSQAALNKPPVAAPATNAPPSRSMADGISDAMRNSSVLAPIAKGSDTRAVLGGTADDISSKFNKGDITGAAGAAIRGSLATVPALAVDSARGFWRGAAAPVVDGVARFGKGLFGVEDSPAKPATTSPQVKTKPVSPASVTATQDVIVTPPDTPADASVTTAPTTTPSAPASQPVPGNVTREGDEYDANGNLTKVGNKYSGNNIGENFTINGAAPNRGGYMQGVAGGGVGSNSFGVTSNGFIPSSSRSGGGRAVLIGDSTTDERNARISNGLSPYGGSPNGQLTANQVRTLAGLKESEDQNKTSRYNTDANNQSAMERTEAQEQGADRRSAVPQAVALEQLELNRTEQGFKTKAAQRMENALAKLDAATTPEERAAASETIRDLNGQKENLKDYFVESGGGQRWDPNAMTTLQEPKKWIDLRTGQAVGDRQSQADSQDEAALQWAKANPNDPRAEKIKRRLGL